MPPYRTYAFENLDAYKKARDFRQLVYQLTIRFPAEERYGLTSQIRRSVSSMTTNLVEGTGKASAADKAHFTNMAYASGLETIDHLNGALDLKYITNEEHTALRLQIDKVMFLINKLYDGQLKQGNNLKDHYRNKHKNAETPSSD